MHELLRYRWAISEAYFNQMYPVFQDALRLGHTLGKKKSMEDFLAGIESLLSIADEKPIDIGADVQITFGQDAPSGLPIARVNDKNIALIPVIGPLTKYGDLCSMGMQDYQRLINRANASETIHGIVAIMDTPGGTVDGTPEFGLTIKNSLKPVGIFGDGMVASAGVWLASQAKVIVGNKNNPTSFGSIGVLMALPNYQNVMDAGNLPKVEIFRAKQSSEKALVNSIEPISDEGRAQLQEELNSIASDFIATVKAGRGDKLDTKTPGIFNGRMYDVAEAKKAGLIDAIGTLQTAVNEVAKLARQQKQPINTGINTNANMKFPKLSALFSGEAWGKALSAFTDDESPLVAAEQQVATMEANLTKAAEEKSAAESRATAAEATVSELTTRVSTLESEKTTITNQVTALEGEKTTLTAKVTDLEAALAKKPTGQSTTILSTEKEEKQVNEDETAAAGKDKYLTSVDREAAQIRETNAKNQKTK